MKKIFLTMGVASLAANLFAQGYVVFENYDNSSGNVTLYSANGPLAEPTTYQVALLWYNGTSFQQLDVYTTTDNDIPGQFYAGTVTVPTYSATGTFMIQGWTGNYPNFAAAVAAGIASGTNVLVGQTTPFVVPEGTNAADAVAICPYYLTPTNLWWNGNLILAPVSAVISNQPVSTSTFVGSNVTLSVTAAGAAPLNYQWQFDGTNVPAATNSTLNFTNVQLTNAGYYDVIITDGYGSVVTSSVAALSVGPAGSPSVYVNSNLAAITASAVDSASITMTPGFANGFIFYTLDGSTPTDASTLYSGPFTLTNSAVINALGYSSDFSETAEMQPLALALYTVNTSVSGSGSVSLSPSTNASGSNSVVTLTATASTNWAFSQWEGDVNSTINPLTVTVGSNLNIEGVFVPTAYPLTLTTPGGGTLLANGQAVTAAYYATNSVVTLTAVTNSGWTFMGWQGGIGSSTNPYYLQMDGPYRVRGVFDTALTTNAVGGGQIVLNTASNLFSYGDVVTASAVPSNGNYFVVWSGVASGTNSPVTTAVTNTTLAALFATLPQSKLSLSVVVLGGGSASINPQQSYYNYGDKVTLTATSNNPSVYFDGWSGGDNDTNSATVVTVTTNLVVYANFSAAPRPGIVLNFTSQGANVKVSGLVGSGPVIIYSSTDLMNWQPIFTNPAASGSVQYLDTNALGAPFRYYRAAVQ